MTINGVNDAPDAVADGGVGFETDEDSAFTTASVLLNDTDVDASDTLIVSALDTTGTLGTVVDNGDGTFDYNPNGAFEALAAGETATDTFSYTVSDQNGGTDTATVTITINGVDDDPGLNDITGTSGNDYLVGTSGADAIRSLGGSFDQMVGGGGADQFIFGSETSNGVREFDMILDYEVGSDSIVLDTGTNINAIREGASFVAIFLDGDNDAIYVRGNGVTADNLTIEFDDLSIV